VKDKAKRIKRKKRGLFIDGYGKMKLLAGKIEQLMISPLSCCSHHPCNYFDGYLRRRN
jgi:hypothetical protein